MATNNDSVISRLCALQWVTVIHDHIFQTKWELRYGKSGHITLLINIIESNLSYLYFSIRKNLLCKYYNAWFEIQKALTLSDPSERKLEARDREFLLFLLTCILFIHTWYLPKVVRYVRELQPPDFIFIPFAIEIDKFITKRNESSKSIQEFSRDFEFITVFV